MKKISWILLGVAVIIIILQRACSGCAECDAETITETTIDTVWTDTIEREIEVDVPDYVYHDTGTTRWRDMLIDTMAILQDYFSRYYYVDTIGDSTFTAVIMDTVTQNRISSRRFIYKNLSPSTIVTNTTTLKPKRKLFVGGMVGGNATQLSAGGGLMYQTRKDHAYSYMYDAVNNQHHVILYWKIRVKPP